ERYRGPVDQPGVGAARGVLGPCEQALVAIAGRVHLPLQELGLDGALADVADHGPLCPDRLREQRLLLLRGLEVGAHGIGERLLCRAQLAPEGIDLRLHAPAGGAVAEAGPLALELRG